MARTLVLDLDGTLVDSVPESPPALNRLMAARGLAAFTRPETAAMVGDGVEKLLERAFAARGQELDGAALAAFSSDYAAHAAVETRPFPGVAAGLRALAGEGWRLAVCTNKPDGAARALLSALGPGGCSPRWARATVFRRASRTRRICWRRWRQAGGSPERAVMTGDHANDVKAAHGAGLPCIFAAWGYGGPAMAEGADAVARDFIEAADFANLLPPPFA